mgnify:FL=1
MSQQNGEAVVPQANEAQQPATQFALQRIYIKDLSFESPKSPEVFREDWQPAIELSMNTQHRQLGEDFYEIVLSLTVTAKSGEDVAFIAEVQQAGIFLLQGFEDGQLHHALASFCPNMLFPYARETLDSVVVKGSFPALMLAPINFDALYAQELERQQQAQAAQN